MLGDAARPASKSATRDSDHLRPRPRAARLIWSSVRPASSRYRRAFSPMTLAMGTKLSGMTVRLPEIANVQVESSTNVILRSLR